MQPSVEQKSAPRGRGLLVGCLIVGGLGVLVVVGFFFLIGGPGFAQDSYRMMSNAATAPGVSDLTKSMCAQAAVTDLDELHRLGEKMKRVGPRTTPDVRFNVACFVADGSKAPSCDDVAALYVHAAGVQPNRINVVVRIGQTRDSSHLRCSILYPAEGASLGDVPEVLD
jgi:hypothetical protein